MPQCEQGPAAPPEIELHHDMTAVAGDPPGGCRGDEPAGAAHRDDADRDYDHHRYDRAASGAAATPLGEAAVATVFTPTAAA